MAAKRNAECRTAERFFKVAKIRPQWVWDASPRHRPERVHCFRRDVAADKAFVVYGGEETYRLKPGIEAIGLRPLQEMLLAREQGE
jgi:hypothetical protein